MVTGGRAEFGLLEPLMRAIAASPTLRLQIVATGSHLSPEFGYTVDAIAASGFTVDETVEMLLSTDSATGIAKSVGLGVIGFADAFRRLGPDIVVVLGDRFEILAAAQTAMLLNLPIAHLCGGDVTLGAVDESIRHAITKMAHLHFVTNAEAAARVRQMGEDPARVHLVGSTGIDAIMAIPRLSRAELEAGLGVALRPRTIVVTFHPVTLDEDAGIAQVRALIDALETLPDDVGVVVTLPNSDTAGRRFAAMMRTYADGRPQVSVHVSLGQKRYYSLLAEADAVVGNSSSGLAEAPSFGTATVNIGDRQQGRLRGPSVIDCPAEAGAIVAAIDLALGSDFSGALNPYGDGAAAARIVTVLEGLGAVRDLLKKPFFTVGSP